jgi:hypothetical protein
VNDFLKSLLGINGGGPKVSLGVLVRMMVIVVSCAGAYYRIAQKIENLNDAVLEYHLDAWTHSDDEEYMEKYSNVNALKFPPHPKGRIAQRMELNKEKYP